VRVLLVYFNPARDLLPAPPIGMSYVAEATRRAGHAVRVLDGLGRERPLHDVQEALRTFDPQAVGVGDASGGGGTVTS